MRFTIDGAPQGKARPRVVHSASGTHTYTPANTAAYEDRVRLAYRRQCVDWFDAGVPLTVRITAYFSPPVSASKAKARRMLDGEEPPTKRPDWDNIGKIICDALNGLAYHDDAQIIDAVVQKRYAAEPMVVVEITEAKGQEHDA